MSRDVDCTAHMSRAACTVCEEPLWWLITSESPARGRELAHGCIARDERETMRGLT